MTFSFFMTRLLLSFGRIRFAATSIGFVAFDSERDVAGRLALLQLDDVQLLHDSPPFLVRSFSVLSASIRSSWPSVQNGM